MYIAPAISRISTNSGSDLGGLQITIYGSKFTYNNLDVVVRVGYKDCLIDEIFSNRITCTIQPDTDHISRHQNCQPSKEEYPGHAGITTEMFNNRVDWNKKFEFFEDAFANSENSIKSSFLGRFNNEDSFIQMSPRSKGNEMHFKDNYFHISKGWFIAPMTGYYQFLTSGDDAVYFWMNLDHNGKFYNQSSCPMESNRYDVDDSDMILVSKTESWSGEDWMNNKNNQMSDKVIYIEKSQEIYVRSALVEFGGGDFMQIGFKFLGEEKVEDHFGSKNPEYVFHENVYKGDDSSKYWDLEHQKFSKQQKVTDDSQKFIYCDVNSSDVCDANKNYKLEIKYFDAISNEERIVTLETDWENDQDRANQAVYEALAKPTCDSNGNGVFTPLFTNDWEKGTTGNGQFWPYQIPDILNPNHPGAFCGDRAFIAQPGSNHIFNTWHHGRLPKWNVLEWGGNNHVCFAYTGKIIAIDIRAEINFRGGVNRFWVDTPELVTSEKEWKHQCYEWREVIARSEFTDEVSSSSIDDGSLEDRGFTKFEIAEIHFLAEEESSDPDALYFMLDEFKLGYLNDISWSGPVPTKTIKADDGLRITNSIVEFNKHAFEVTIRNSRQAQSNTPNLQCGWKMVDAVLYKVDQEIKNIESIRISHPTGLFSGTWQLEGQQFETYEDPEIIQEFLKNTLNYNVNVELTSSCETSWGYDFKFTDEGVNPALMNFDLSNVSSGNSEMDAIEANIETVTEAGFILYRWSPNWIRTVSKVPQVTVIVGNAPAICRGNCDFNFEEKHLVSDINYSNQNQVLSWQFESTSESDVQVTCILSQLF